MKSLTLEACSKQQLEQLAQRLEKKTYKIQKIDHMMIKPTR